MSEGMKRTGQEREEKEEEIAGDITVTIKKDHYSIIRSIVARFEVNK